MKQYRVVYLPSFLEELNERILYIAEREQDADRAIPECVLDDDNIIGKGMQLLLSLNLSCLNLSQCIEAENVSTTRNFGFLKEFKSLLPHIFLSNAV